LTDLQSNVHCNAFDAPCSVKIINDQLYSPSSVVDNTIRQQKEKKINSLHSSTKKITAYYNIYNTDCPHSYTVTKTCLVVS